MKRFLPILTFCTAAWAAVAQKPAYRTLEAIPYNSTGDERCRLDLCYPADSTDFTTVVRFHDSTPAASHRASER